MYRYDYVGITKSHETIFTQYVWGTLIFSLLFYFWKCSLKQLSPFQVPLMHHNQLSYSIPSVYILKWSLCVFLLVFFSQILIHHRITKQENFFWLHCSATAEMMIYLVSAGNHYFNISEFLRFFLRWRQEKKSHCCTV